MPDSGLRDVLENKNEIFDAGMRKENPSNGLGQV